MREAFDRSNGVVEQVKHFVVVPDCFVCHGLGKNVCQEWTAVLDEALRDDIAELRDQAFIHKHLVKFSFFCVN